MGRGKVFAMAVDALRGIISLRAGIVVVMGIFSTEDASRFAFTGFANMAHPVAGETYFNFRNKRKYLVAVSAEENILGKNLSGELEADRTRWNIFCFAFNSDSPV